jgi:hypothetical protein
VHATGLLEQIPALEVINLSQIQLALVFGKTGFVIKFHGLFHDRRHDEFLWFHVIASHRAECSAIEAWAKQSPTKRRKFLIRSTH